MNFKKIISIFSFIILTITLTCCSRISQEHYLLMNEVLGFALPSSSKCVEHYVTEWQGYSGFEMWDLSEDDPTEELKTLEQWHYLPIPDEEHNKLYVKYKTFQLSDGDKEYVFPRDINDGFYLYIEDKVESFNYFFAMFDNLDKKLYLFYRKDYYEIFEYESDSAQVFGFTFPCFNRRKEKQGENKHFITWDFYFKSRSINFEELEQWNPLPLSTELEERVYGKEEKRPEFSVYEQELYTFPVVTKGYYFYIEEIIGEYLFAMFDSETKMLYMFYK